MNLTSKSFFRHRNVLLVEILIVAAGGMALHAQTNAPSAPGPEISLAAMNEDVQGLLREVNDLNLQLKALQQENDGLKKQVLTKSDVQNLIDNSVAKSRADARTESRNDLTQATTTLRKDIADDMKTEIGKLTDLTNAQLDKLAKAINDLQAKRATPAPSNIPPPHFPPPDMSSQNGVQYTVLPNDNLSKIAKKFGTSVSDLQMFNHLPDTNVRSGQVIFVPQKPGASAPTPTPIPATTAPAAPAGR